MNRVVTERRIAAPLPTYALPESPYGGLVLLGIHDHVPGESVLVKRSPWREGGEAGLSACEVRVVEPPLLRRGAHHAGDRDPKAGSTQRVHERKSERSESGIEFT